MKIGIVADHRGYELKQKVIKFLESKGYNVIDYAPDFIDLDDYPDYGIKLGEKLVAGEVDYGIAICSNGVGMSIACNKVKGIRCGKVDNRDEAEHAKAEDDINIIALSAAKSIDEVEPIILAFLNTNFSTVDRYTRRINKIKAYENGEASHEY